MSDRESDFQSDFGQNSRIFFRSRGRPKFKFELRTLELIPSLVYSGKVASRDLKLVLREPFDFRVASSLKIEPSDAIASSIICLGPLTETLEELVR